ncbi:zinc-binding dehydrogenase [Nonomuraea sp. NPDC050536]|uniref:zinc-binding dehydrogenase n=1 Tax=Nonomuraea sp. NPDC050536 TaxID=3364366 RepID=UPI0037CC7142
MRPTMRAMRLHGPGDVRLEDIRRPRPGPGEVLIAVERVGLCGSDVEEYRDAPVSVPVDEQGRIIPIVLGHEVVGIVAECPGGELAEGTRVVPDVVVGCGECWWCRRHEEGLCPKLLVRGQQQDGGLADFMIASAATCVPVPDGVSADRAAFAEPIAVAIRALRKVPETAGAVVVVYGVGTIGQLAVQLAVHGLAAEVVAVDPLSSRRALAEACGAIAATPEEAAEVVASVSGGRGADVVLECAGVETAPDAAVRLSRRGGTTVLVGFKRGSLELPWMDVVLGERRLLGSAAHLWDEEVTAAVALLARDIIDPTPLHTGTVPLADSAAALERAATDRSVFKLLIAPERTT